MRSYDWTDREPSAPECRTEVEGLHEFFVDWFTGELPPEGFDRVGDALAPGFSRVDPDGDQQDRETILTSIEETHGAYGRDEFDIDIRNLQVSDSGDTFALVTYEEWQTTPDGENGRISSALLRPTPAAPSGLAWVSLQETWLEH